MNFSPKVGLPTSHSRVDTLPGEKSEICWPEMTTPGVDDDAGIDAFDEHDALLGILLIHPSSHLTSSPVVCIQLSVVESPKFNPVILLPAEHDASYALPGNVHPGPTVTKNRLFSG